ncbi:MAG TPA: amidohydrolase family protein [Acidimicrobiia bacterium]|nr:amidohydrolase family protein [Acidimicrobiia bacterium]
MTVIDADSHIYETRDLWVDRVDARDRELALRITDDSLGYATLVLGDRRIETLGIHDPGDVSQSGVFRERMRQGLPPERAYDDMPRDFWDPEARVTKLQEFGIDASIVFGNCAIMWEHALWDDADATRVNMQAWNRRVAELVVESRGRLAPVAQISLHDPDWCVDEIEVLARNGVRLATLSPAPVAGRRLSHPHHDAVWRAAAEHGVAIVFHIAQYPSPFDPAWTADDPDWSNPLLGSVFMWTGPALALADLATRGVLARNPDLRIGVVELMSAWVPMFLLQLDGGFSFHARFNGRPIADLAEPPSAYLRRQMRVASFGFERPAQLARQAGDIFMFGSDYPHPEGLAHPVDDFRTSTGIEPATDDALYRANAAWLAGI